MTWSRLLKLAKGNVAPKENDVRQKVDAVKRLVRQRVKAVSQRERFANLKAKLVAPVPIVLMLASPKVIVSRKPAVRVIDVRRKEAAHPKETDVAQVVMLVVVRPMAVVPAMANGVVRCHDSLRFSTAITMAGLVVMNWIA